MAELVGPETGDQAIMRACVIASRSAFALRPEIPHGFSVTSYVPGAVTERSVFGLSIVCVASDPVVCALGRGGTFDKA